MALTARLDGDTKGLSSTLMALVEELSLGVAQLDEEGSVLELNEPAQQLFDGPSGMQIRKSLKDACGRAGPLTQPAEFVVSLGGTGELRVLLARAEQRAGFVAMLERSLEARLRIEVTALRAMLAAAADSVPPREAALRALRTIAGSLAGCGLVLHEIDESGPALVPVAQAGLKPNEAMLAADLPLDPKTSTLSRAAVYGQPIHLPDLARSPFPGERALGAGQEKKALLAVPVRVGGRVTGVLGVCHPAGTLGDGEMRMVQGLADAVGTLLERARADAAMAAEVAARRSLMENLPDAIVEQGRAGVISLAAGRVQPILGRGAADVVGVAIEELLVAEDREGFRKMVEAVHGSTPLADEFTVLTPDGRHVPCEVSVCSNGEKGSEILRAVFRDISTRRALEADVVQAREIATRREKLAAIGQLAAGVAHEINNPLSFVKSNLSTMTTHLEDLTERLEKVSPLLEPPVEGDLTTEEILGDMRDMAHESHSGIERIASIVQALKGMARSRGDDRIAFSPAKSIQDAALIFRGAKRGCTVDVKLDTLPQIKGSPGALGQVILNLLDNALDAMDGEGTITVVATDAGERLKITVSDTGGGIPMSARERVFEPFFTTKESGKGTGLGLYICYEIVKQMSGEIRFETGDTGTTFVIEIPAAV